MISDADDHIGKSLAPVSEAALQFARPDYFSVVHKVGTRAGTHYPKPVLALSSLTVSGIIVCKGDFRPFQEERPFYLVSVGNYQ